MSRKSTQENAHNMENSIEKLEKTKKNTNNPVLKESIKNKMADLKGSKTVLK